VETIVAARAEELSTALHISHGRSAASWGAIVAGALVAAAVSLIMLALGAGLGLTAVSPWQGYGVTAATFAATTAIWFIVTQWVAAGLGGYIAGRLRTRWIGTHTHEVFFRDTAHGLVTWALATVVVVSVLGSYVSSLIGGGFHAATTVAAGGVESIATSSMSPAANYRLDKLFRGSGDSPSGTTEHRGEAAHILANAVTSGEVPAADRAYLAALISNTTGTSAAEAEKRVDDAAASAIAAQTKVKELADAGRKASAEAAIFTALAMLVGAFIASVSAALGGRVRDQHP
jgi:hypothetical protein